MRQCLAAFAIFATLTLSSVEAAEREPFIRSGQRIVFLGDSNTHAGHFITFLETWLRQHYPEGQWTLINLGMPGETASGLSEPDHPYPRPCIDMRLQSALEKSKPDLVVIGYGTNDGIYYPFSEERFSAYREGITKLIGACRQTGAKIVLMTPPPFDPVPMRKAGRLKPAGTEKFTWSEAYEGYDEVMDRFAAWVLTQEKSADLVIDIRSPMVAEMKRAQNDPAVAAVLPDGIHYNTAGHRIVATKLWVAWNLTPSNPGDDPPEELSDIVGRRQKLLRDAWVMHVGHTRPDMPVGLPLIEAEAQAEQLLKTGRSAP